MKSVDAQSESIWQGYVAAIASLLIGLLLLVSLFAMAIGLIGGLQESYRKTVQAAGFKDANAVNDFFRDLKAPGTDSQAADLPNDGKVDGKVDVKVDVKAALEIYSNTPGSEQKRLQAQLAELKLDRIKLDALNLDKRDPGKPLSASELAKINFDAINWGQLSTEEINLLKPFVAQFALNTWKTNQEKVKTPPPKKEIPPAATATDDMAKLLRLVFLEESTQITPNQAQQLVAWAKEWRRRGSTIQITSVWPGTSDPLVGRTIYLRMANLRETLVQAGIEGSAIAVNLERDPATDDPKDIRVFIRELSK